MSLDNLFYLGLAVMLTVFILFGFHPVLDDTDKKIYNEK